MARTQATQSFFSPLVAVAALILVSAGCNSGTEEPAAPAPEAPSASSTLETPPATSDTPDTAQERKIGSDTEIDPSRFPKLREGMLAEVPDNFPNEMPIYPNAAPAQGRGGQVEGKDLSALQLVSNDAPDEALTYYERELAAKGWDIEKSEARGEAATLSVRRGGCTVSILITPTEDGGSDIFNVSECEN